MAGHPDRDQALVAVVRGRIVGCIMSTRPFVVSAAGARAPAAAVGPLGVLSSWQGRSIGSLLLREALARARRGGEVAAFLYGAPAYYGRFGFEHARRWSVTTADGANFGDFMGIELIPGALSGVAGRLEESPVFEVDPADVAAFDERGGH